MSANERYIAAPGLACFIIVVWLFLTLKSRDQQIPFIDAGMFCALATLAYTIYPLINFWVNGFQFGFLSDNRLVQYNPSSAEMGIFHIRHVLYLFSFVFFYSVFRCKGTVEVGKMKLPGGSTQLVVVLFFLFFTAYFLILQMATGINYNSSYDPEVFANRVSAFANTPLIILQISGKLGGILFLFKLGVLFIVISRCRQKKWFVILLIWIAVEIILTFAIKGSRTGLVLFLISTALFYHKIIKPLSVKFLITSGATLFVFFIFLGLYRAYIDFTSLQSDLSQAEGGIFSRNNEFQSLLGTAYDVSMMKKSGVNLPWYLYINDFMAILPPQQFLPFEKVSASEWYLRQIGKSGTGQGFMWGIISQAIVGLDWIELVIRGAILGFILARIHRWYIKHQSGFLETLLYIFLCIKVYYTFRDTTLSLLSNFVWEVIPFYILLRLGKSILISSSQIELNKRAISSNTPTNK